MSKTEHYDVIIVGAGMVGATLGALLGQRQMRVLLVDHAAPLIPYQEQQPPDLRISALNTFSMLLLKEVGVWPFLERRRLCPFYQMHVWETGSPAHQKKGRWPVSMPFLDEKSNQLTFDCMHLNQPSLGCVVENRVFQEALYEYIATLNTVTLLPHVTIEQLISHQACDTEICLQEKKGSYRTPLIIGADGAQSKVRHWAGFGVSCRHYGQHALVITVEIKEGPLNVTWQAFAPTGPMALLPLPVCHNKYYASLVWYHHPDEIQYLLSLDEHHFLQILVERFPDTLPDIVRVHQRGYFPLMNQHAHRYVDHGIALVGDAAHTINPLAGQGVNLGLMDIAILADVLTDALEKKISYATLECLEAYQRIRRRDNCNMALILDAFYYGFSNSRLPLKIVRNMGMILARHVHPFVRYVGRYGSGCRGASSTIFRRMQKNQQFF